MCTLLRTCSTVGRQDLRNANEREEGAKILNNFLTVGLPLKKITILTGSSKALVFYGWSNSARRTERTKIEKGVGGGEERG